MNTDIPSGSSSVTHGGEREKLASPLTSLKKTLRYPLHALSSAFRWLVGMAIGLLLLIVLSLAWAMYGETSLSSRRERID
jgi:uncharacterized membrane protein YukC